MERNYRFLSGIFLRTDMIGDNEVERLQTRGVDHENSDGWSPIPLFSSLAHFPCPAMGQRQTPQSSLHPQSERQAARRHHLCSDEPRLAWKYPSCDQHWA